MSKKPRARWPKHLIIPSEAQFSHGTWAKYVWDMDDAKSDSEEEECIRLEKAADAASDMYLPSPDPQDIEALKYSCNTQCCLVGWAALAMNEKEGCHPDALKNPATAKFLNKFIELAGFDPIDESKFPRSSDFICAVGDRASDVFEGMGVNLRGMLSPQRARELWKKTAEHFGYDTENLFE